MPGGTPEAYQHIEAIVEKVAAQVSGALQLGHVIDDDAFSGYLAAM